MHPPLNQLDPLAWKQLVEAIAAEKCIVFLGPGVTVNYHDPDRQAHFFMHLAEKYPQRILSYHNGDGFLVYKDNRSKLLLLSEIKEIYRTTPANDVQELLAQIPFHLYIVVTPDKSLNQAFDKQDLSYKHQFYATKIKQSLEESPTAMQPLLYNLLGCESEPESIVTNHSDFLDLIQSIYGDKNLPDDLVACLNANRTHNILFLGFEFDKWHFQLLLHLLRINFEEGFLYAAAEGLPSDDNKTLMEAQFKVSFVSNHIQEFVTALHQQFSEAQLRKPLPAAARRKHNLANILKFMANAWTSPEFESFCFVNFGEVQAEFTSEMTQSTRHSLLLKHLVATGQILRFLEIGREENPYQFDDCGPYYDEN